MKNIAVGRYIPTASLIHQLDPRLKLVTMVLFIATLMMAEYLWQYGVLVVLLFVLVGMTRISVGIFLKGIRPLLKIILFTAVLQLLFTTRGELLAQWWIVTITTTGVLNGVTVFLRFSMIIVMTSVIGLSTKPLDLTRGLGSLLKPFGVVGVKGENVGLILAIALRFIPTLFDEGARLKKAQESRGMQFDEGNFIQRLKKFAPLLIPIFIGSFTRANELANALDVRGYVGGVPRTAYKSFGITVVDGIYVCVFGGMLALNFIL